MHYLYDSHRNTYRKFESRTEAETVCLSLQDGAFRFRIIADGSAAAVAIDFATEEVTPDELGDLVANTCSVEEQAARIAHAKQEMARMSASDNVLTDLQALWQARAEGYDFGQPYPTTSGGPWRIESNDVPGLYWEASTPEGVCTQAATWMREQSLPLVLRPSRT
jgi:hypothetical protein